MTIQTETLGVLPIRYKAAPYNLKRHENLLDAPVPGGERDHWSIGSILALFPALPSWPMSQRYGHRNRVTEGARMILEWLESHPGNGWQERWVNSGADSGMNWVDTLVADTSVADDPRSPTTRRTQLSAGLGSLLLCRVVFPSYSFLAAYKAHALYAHTREVFRPDLFAQIQNRRENLKIPRHTTKQAPVVISKIVLHTGRDVDQLTDEDILTFRAWALRHTNGRVGIPGLRAAWALLYGFARLGGYATLRDAVRQGQRPTAELVDAYPIQSLGVRDALVRYLDERRPALDYNTFTSLVGVLVGNFWVDIERHHPDMDSLDLPRDVAAAWKERVKTVTGRDGSSRPRKDYHSVLMTVRGLYRDIQEWALEDPSWAQWSFPNPVRKADLAGYSKAQKRTTAAMHQRIRERLPHLPALVDTAERHKADMAALHTSAAEVAIGTEFVHGGRKYLRSAPKTYETSTYFRDATPPLHVEDLTTGEILDLGQAEHDAFWAWAAIEVLRHTGIRIEEMLEITHLGLISYKLRDTGEVVPMLQIVPSKSNEERLLLVGPEFASVLATIITRLRRRNGGTVPLTGRYDTTEHLVGPPLPHLFQHTRNGWTWEVPTPNTVYKLLDQTFARAGLTTADGEPLRYRPHDFRRMFATEAATGGLPVHILARILGHANINTTQAYLAEPSGIASDG